MSSQFNASWPGGELRLRLSGYRPVDQLAGMHAAGEQIEAWLTELVTDARRSGASWAQIGTALGVTRQAAWQAYHDQLDSTAAEDTVADDAVAEDTATYESFPPQPPPPPDEEP